jgi:hypothetical protein
MVGGMLLIVSDFLELLVVGFDKVEAYYHGNLCRRNRADSARHSAVRHPQLSFCFSSCLYRIGRCASACIKPGLA